MVDKIGPPLFYQPKVFSKPDFCYWGYFKPFVLHDGYVYHCSSVVLNQEAERQFHAKYRMGTIEEYCELIKDKIVPYIPKSCSHCVFCTQNETIHDLLNPTGMENFI
jgi:hypothetical protein